MALINGDNGNNLEIGSSEADQIFGFGGIDLLRGSDGNDTIEGGEGPDSLSGDKGNDPVATRARQLCLVAVGRRVAKRSVRPMSAWSASLRLGAVEAALSGQNDTVIVDEMVRGAPRKAPWPVIDARYRLSRRLFATSDSSRPVRRSLTASRAKVR